jgi:DNA recombination protein RmuC
LQEELSHAEAKILKVSEERSAAQAKLEQMVHVQQALEEKTGEVKDLTATIMELKEKQAELEIIIEKERLATEEKLQLLEKAKEKLTDTFQAISAIALKNSQESFLDLATATLAKYQEAARADLELRQKEVQQLLHKETANLVKALRTPQVRGRWGEITLRRVAELAGMLRYCDFCEQETRDTGQGRLRPDMIVRLPNERQIIVDAKAPLLAYLDALEAQTEEERTSSLVLHSKQIQAHMNKLSQKSYWEQFQPTPEFVVLFIPGENFFSSALEQNPGLIEEGVDKGVILATPTTLISLLKAVAFGWRQETMAKNAEIISNLGKELYVRIGAMAEHLGRLGTNIDKCVSTYNHVIGSFERRVLASARKFTEVGITKRDGVEIPLINPVEKTTRQISLVSSNECHTSGAEKTADC